jgi:uncharacterized membrane protein
MSAPVAQRDATRAAAHRIASMLIGVGSLHFLAPKPFDTIVPAELPGQARVYTYTSGLAEISIGALLLSPRTRRLAALAVVFLFVGVFPAIFNMPYNNTPPLTAGTAHPHR